MRIYSEEVGYGVGVVSNSKYCYGVVEQNIVTEADGIRSARDMTSFSWTSKYFISQQTLPANLQPRVEDPRDRHLESLGFDEDGHQRGKNCGARHIITLCFHL